MNSRTGFTGPINIGNPSEYTMFDLAKKIINLTNSGSKIVFKELPQDDPMQRKPVIELAKKELRCEPHVTLEEGLKKTIEYFRNIL